MAARGVLDFVNAQASTSTTSEMALHAANKISSCTIEAVELGAEMTLN